MPVPAARLRNCPRIDWRIGSLSLDGTSAGRLGSASGIRVFTTPGQSTVTPMSSPPARSSSARHALAARMANLDVVYGAKVGRPVANAASEAVFTTCPSPCSRISGRKMRQPWSTPHRFRSSTHSQAR